MFEGILHLLITKTRILTVLCCVLLSSCNGTHVFTISADSIIEINLCQNIVKYSVDTMAVFNNDEFYYIKNIVPVTDSSFILLHKMPCDTILSFYTYNNKKYKSLLLLNDCEKTIINADVVVYDNKLCLYDDIVGIKSCFDTETLVANGDVSAVRFEALHKNRIVQLNDVCVADIVLSDIGNVLFEIPISANSYSNFFRNVRYDDELYSNVSYSTTLSVEEEYSTNYSVLSMYYPVIINYNEQLDSIKVLNINGLDRQYSTNESGKCVFLNEIPFAFINSTSNNKTFCCQYIGKSVGAVEDFDVNIMKGCLLFYNFDFNTIKCYEGIPKLDLIRFFDDNSIYGIRTLDNGDRYVLRFKDSV